MNAPQQPINQEMGDLLWRRVYQARADAEAYVPPMLAVTLEALLNRTGIPKPKLEREPELYPEREMKGQFFGGEKAHG